MQISWVLTQQLDSYWQCVTSMALFIKPSIPITYHITNNLEAYLNKSDVYYEPSIAAEN